ncbi:MAG: tyrosine-type recombinase/integrase [Candidatus Desulfaltia sp.]|nr:tyrosine-type recombinase/integrase [Candidatus Desulfaltia sp.]
MLHQYMQQFLSYCQIACFSERSIETLTVRLNEFNAFIIPEKLKSPKKITYNHLIDFVSDFKLPSVHVKKSRVWTLRQFFHFLVLNQWISKNIARDLPYPKIEKTVPKFLTIEDFNQIIKYLSGLSDSPMGLRNLMVMMLLGMLGLRTSSLMALNIQDVDVTCGLIWINEKGRRRRTLLMPYVLCELMQKYLNMGRRKTGPLFLSKRNRRISQRSLQNIFRTVADQTGIEKKLHAHLFRHTAATHLNKVAGIDVTQHVLGHARRSNTMKYAHLNPDQYAVYMRQHPYMKKEAS